jgi:hypothetical protein
MFNDVDETLREFLLAEVPVDRTEVDISFDRPTREWSSKLSRPTLNVFVHDIRERQEFRDNERVVVRNSDGSVTSRLPARRIDLTYVVTAWTKEAADEHRILARILAALFRFGQIPDKYLQGDLLSADLPLLVRIMPPDHLVKAADFWGVMDNELHASITLVATSPLDAFAPVTGPAVRTRELRAGDTENEWREVFLHVGGLARAGGEALAGARVEVVGTTIETVTGDDGSFVLGPLHEGDYTWRITTAGNRAFERAVRVPADAYDIELGAE